MRQYIYQPSDIGRDAWPAGELRLDGIERTLDPAEADVFVCPGGLTSFRHQSELDAFPFMAGRENRHVFFHCADDEMLYGRPCMFIRCNAQTRFLNVDVNTIAAPWPVEDYAECIDVPERGFKYDVSFQGWMWSEPRKQSAEGCLRSNLICDFAGYSDFTGYIFNEPEGRRRRSEFRRSMRESRIALCPESIPGHFPYRFWEAMSAGRVPLLVGTGQMFPFAKYIPYHEFTLSCSAERAGWAGTIAREFIDTHSDDQIIEMGRQARHYWDLWLNSVRWPELMAISVRDKWEELQCALSL